MNIQSKIANAIALSYLVLTGWMVWLINQWTTTPYQIMCGYFAIAFGGMLCMIVVHHLDKSAK